CGYPVTSNESGEAIGFPPRERTNPDCGSQILLKVVLDCPNGPTSPRIEPRGGREESQNRQSPGIRRTRAQSCGPDPWQPPGSRAWRHLAIRSGARILGNFL